MWCLCNDHCLDIVMVIWSSSNCPIVIRLPTVCYFSQEKPLVKPTGPWSLFIIFAFAIYFLLHLFSDLLKQKFKKYLAAIYLFRDLFILSSNLPHFLCLSWGAVPRKELTTPLTRRVARSCYLCAGVVYVVLLGTPTGSITLVSYLREIPTTVVLHHPFLFGEIPT